MVEPVELMAPVLGKSGVGGHGAEQTGRQGGIDTLEELEEDDGDRISPGSEGDSDEASDDTLDGYVAVVCGVLVCRI